MNGCIVLQVVVSLYESSVFNNCLLHRLNFTLRHMEVTCEAYDHFRHCLDELSNMEDGRMQYKVERVPSQSIPQFFQYERVQYLVSV